MVSKPSSRRQSPTLILASASPGRAELLRTAGFRFRQIPAGIPEPPRPPQLSIRTYLLNLAGAKAQAIAQLHPQAFVIGADTVLEFDGALIGKPAHAAAAYTMLRRLRCKPHKIWTAVCLIGPTPSDGSRRPSRRFIDTAQVILRSWSDTQLHHYIRTARPFFCAGAYAVQGEGLSLVQSIRGDIATVIGLPLDAVTRGLLELGHPGPTL
jgi:septum formation protein